MLIFPGNNPLFPSLPDGSRDVALDWDYVETWEGMEKLPATGKVKAIGVANWSKKYLERLVETAKIVPAANQIENHPLLPQDEIVDYCKSKGIQVTAYSPLGSTGTPLFSLPEVAAIAKKHSVGPANVLISWHGKRGFLLVLLLTRAVARGSSVIPKSVTPSRIDENRKIIDLDSEDMEILNGLLKSHGLKRLVFPPFKV
jgi:glycerol 2-dehydrogenase (NADP+)